MQPAKKPTAKNGTAEGATATDARVPAEAGLVLVDASLKVIAADSGAGAIFNDPDQRSFRVGAPAPLPGPILALIRGRQRSDFPCLRTPVSIGGREYVFRAHWIELGYGTMTQSVLALHLEHDGFTDEVMAEVGAAYNLTQREQEALAGILIGLSTKELAQRMNISPNTVKAFLRLIMIKMGVTTRAGIFARILHDRGAGEPEHADSPSAGDARFDARA